MITYFKSQKDLANALINLIDSYWCSEINEQLFLERINEIVSKNNEKVYREEDYTSVIRQRLGKRRIELLDKVLK
ncbi:hypothetical protein Amet_1606 [Alkaliphilus metalliredigens QYMF]|uniref:Uncharacterized protein n=1 Tax=Alkaliphilus metalliredigens (strain QYMF) TaxID=293826 RepID=A6TNL5_ALKMQ|nr:TIGR04540 family protein [Alkaliphilus metalliredigens]ABR47783.1 hypothetical protein Amet_1606 [Alkaliphilus metalliredigens QYMF]